MARLYNGMTEEEILAAGKTFSLGTPEVARRRADVKAALDKVNNATWEDAEERAACLMQATRISSKATARRSAAS